MKSLKVNMIDSHSKSARDPKEEDDNETDTETESESEITEILMMKRQIHNYAV